MAWEATDKADTSKADAAEHVLSFLDSMFTMIEGRQLFGTATHNVIQGMRAIQQEAQAILAEEKAKGTNGGQGK